MTWLSAARRASSASSAGVHVDGSLGRRLTMKILVYGAGNMGSLYAALVAIWLGRTF